ncbi:MAG: o-succinylbenzoate synthase [Victivallales bacterium]|nr:o-succinylbenzoate synthase [Victivallales bacterium]
MRIERIEIYHDAVPLKRPFVTAFGSTETVEAILVRMVSGGCSGWGESSPLGSPGYSPEYAAGAFRVARDFILPVLTSDTEIASADELQERMQPIRGNYFAKAAFDMAYHDLSSRKEGIPLWRHFGGTRDRISCGLDFGIRPSIPELLQELEQAIQAGYGCIKLKFGPSCGIDMLARVRERFPDFPFFIDCNAAYTLKDLDLFRELDRFNLMMYEQPLAWDDIADHAELQHQIRTPICLDESLTTPDRARQAAQCGACRIFNLKPGRMGGYSPAIRTMEIAARAGISCWVGGMFESSVGRAGMIALASRSEVNMPSDITPPLKKYCFDLVERSIDYAPCPWFPQTALPGSGQLPDSERLAQVTREHHVWEI